VPLDREFIQRRDFPTARRGLEPEAVQEHLRVVADEVQLLRRAAEAPASDPLAAAASAQVRAIVAAAEAGAAELREEAATDARAHVDRIAGVAGELLSRIEEYGRELDAIMGGVRAGAARLAAEVARLDAEAAAPVVRGAPPVPGAPPASAPPGREPGVGEVDGAERDAGRDEAANGAPPGDSAPTASVAAAVAAGEGRKRRARTRGFSLDDEAGAPADAAGGGADAGGARGGPAGGGGPAAGGRDADEAGARMVALDMALSGSPREEAERYLTEHFAALEDPRSLLDDVYARAGR